MADPKDSGTPRDGNLTNDNQPVAARRHNGLLYQHHRHVTSTSPALGNSSSRRRGWSPSRPRRRPDSFMSGPNSSSDLSFQYTGSPPGSRATYRLVAHGSIRDGLAAESQERSYRHPDPPLANDRYLLPQSHRQESFRAYAHLYLMPNQHRHPPNSMANSPAAMSVHIDSDDDDDNDEDDEDDEDDNSSETDDETDEDSNEESDEGSDQGTDDDSSGQDPTTKAEKEGGGDRHLRMRSDGSDDDSLSLAVENLGLAATASLEQRIGDSADATEKAPGDQQQSSNAKSTTSIKTGKDFGPLSSGKKRTRRNDGRPGRRDGESDDDSEEPPKYPPRAGSALDTSGVRRFPCFLDECRNVAPFAQFAFLVRHLETNHGFFFCIAHSKSYLRTVGTPSGCPDCRQFCMNPRCGPRSAGPPVGRPDDPLCQRHVRTLSCLPKREMKDSDRLEYLEKTYRYWKMHGSKSAAETQESGAHAQSSVQQLLKVARRSVELYADSSSGPMDEDLWHLLDIDAPYLISKFELRRPHAAKHPLPDMNLWRAPQAGCDESGSLSDAYYGIFKDTDGLPHYLDTDATKGLAPADKAHRDGIPRYFNTDLMKDLIPIHKELPVPKSSRSPRYEVNPKHILNIIRKSVQLYAIHNHGNMDNGLYHLLAGINALHLVDDYNARHSPMFGCENPLTREPVRADSVPTMSANPDSFAQSRHTTDWYNQGVGNLQTDFLTNDYSIDPDYFDSAWGVTPMDPTLSQVQ